MDGTTLTFTGLIQRVGRKLHLQYGGTLTERVSGTEGHWRSTWEVSGHEARGFLIAECISIGPG